MPTFSRLFAVLLIAVLTNGPAFSASTSEIRPAAEEPASSEAPLVVFNRTVIVFRAPFMGASPNLRAARARAVLEEVLRNSDSLAVTVKSNPEGQLVLLGDTLTFIVTKADVDPLTGETPQQAAKKAAQRLEQVIAETREARNLKSLLTALIVSAAATLIFVLLLWGLKQLSVWVSNLFSNYAAYRVKALKVGETEIVERHHLAHFFQRMVSVLRWLIIALLTYEWLSFILSRFPYTRSWGERLNGYLLDVAAALIGGILSAVPGLGVAIAIFLLARFGIGFLGGFLERMANREPAHSWLGPDTMPTTRRLFNIAIWLFAVAMAYPYLPGAQTDAFKGLSVLLGLMVSLGASSLIGQGAAGLILTYTRTLRKGEYVRIGEHEGTVTRVGMFTTTMRTGLGEELTLPNSLITGTVTKNYSRAVEGTGFIVDTTVTIGYDAPWRQVEAMLVEAARRTPGIIDPPAPRVFQTALSDYYPEYRLVAQAIPSGPLARAEVLTQLHANIQDVFNEHGVQIMSPHYMMDPDAAKVVKPEDWHRAPAKPPGDEPGRTA